MAESAAGVEGGYAHIFRPWCRPRQWRQWAGRRQPRQSTWVLISHSASTRGRCKNSKTDMCLSEIDGACAKVVYAVGALEFDQPAAIVAAADQIIERSLCEDLDLGPRVKIGGVRASDEQCERADECCRHADIFLCRGRCRRQLAAPARSPRPTSHRPDIDRNHASFHPHFYPATQQHSSRSRRGCLPRSARATCPTMQRTRIAQRLKRRMTPRNPRPAFVTWKNRIGSRNAPRCRLSATRPVPRGRLAGRAGCSHAR
jgi:hypothetical protein